MKIKLLIGALFIFILGACNSGYQKENDKWVLVSYDEAVGKRVTQIDEHDANSFKILKNRDYAIDKNSVFLNGRIIEGADPISFELINKNVYSKDKRHVFLDAEKVIFANPNTFKVLEFPYSKDDKRIFCGTIPLKLNENEIDDFQVTNEDELMSQMKSTTLLSHFIEMNPEYKWLDTVGINAVIVGMWATGETKNRKFKGVKEIEN